MRQFNYLQAIYKSFYSKSFYRDVVNNWGAGVVLYLLLILAIGWVVLMVRMQPSFSHGLIQLTAQFRDQMPNITIKEGKVITPENHPYFVKDPDTKEVIVIIDTTGRYTKLEPDSKYTMLLTEHEFWSADKKGEMRIYKIPKDFTVYINPKVIHEQTVKWVSWVWWIVLFPVFLLAAFIYRLTQALIYAVIGKILALAGGVRLSYGNVWKLTIVALTPGIILGTILDCFEINFPKEFLVYFILSMAYLVYALWANKKLPHQ